MIFVIFINLKGYMILFWQIYVERFVSSYYYLKMIKYVWTYVKKT